MAETLICGSKLKNLMCGSTVIKDVMLADTYVKRFKGYMFCKTPCCNAIILIPCSSIHTFFMKFRIDVLFINEKMEIAKKIENLGPGKLILPVKGVKMVIEGRAGVFKDFEPGCKIEILEAD